MDGDELERRSGLAGPGSVGADMSGKDLAGEEAIGKEAVGGLEYGGGCKVVHVLSYLKGLWGACVELSMVDNDEGKMLATWERVPNHESKKDRQRLLRRSGGRC